MATPFFSLVAEDDLICPVCFELLKDPNTPKNLDCPHVCCAVCIQKLIEGERKIVDCPECRHITRIPEDGVNAMKTNLRLRNLAEKHDENMTKKSKSCPQHHISIDYYCEICNVAGCSTCMMKNHQGPNHDNVDIQRVREEQKTEMNVVIERATDNIEECKKTLQQLQTLKTQTEKYLREQRKSIEKQGEEAIMKVHQECKALSDSLQKEEQRRIDHITEEMIRIQTQVQESENALTTVKSIMETSEPHDLVAQHSELQKNVKVFAENKTKTEIVSNTLVGMSKVVFAKPPAVSVGGRILRVKKVQCKLMTTFGVFQAALFDTATPSGLLVVSDCVTKQVHIYRRQTNGQYKEQSSISLLSNYITENPFGVAVMEDGRYLVATGTHVEIHSPSCKYQGVIDIKYADEKCTRKQGINNVKMMPDGRVLLSDYQNSLLFVLKENITLLLINLKTSIKPTRITTMPNGRVALSSREEGKVCVMDIESGRELKTFDIPYAVALCYHETTDSFLVGRCAETTERGYAKAGSGVLEQYCATTGGFVCRLASGLYNPQEMTFTSSGELVIADCKTVKIFKIEEI